MAQSDANFVGAIPEVYDGYMVPLMFQTYAEDMAARVAALNPGAVLETAAGSGVVTRELAPKLGPKARYVVSDLSPPMLDKAKARQMPDERIEWTVADAQNLPFGDAEFDTLCCQFGVMFFPDKQRGFAEAKRVLRPGARLVFSVWDRLEHNPISEVVGAAINDHFPINPPDFFRRAPFGYCDPAKIRSDLAAAGFGTVTIETVTRESRAPAARDAAVALVQGTPMRMEVVARDPEGLPAVTDAAEAALRRRYGDGPIAGKIQALVVAATA